MNYSCTEFFLGGGGKNNSSIGNAPDLPPSEGCGHAVHTCICLNMIGDQMRRPELRPGGCSDTSYHICMTSSLRY